MGFYSHAIDEILGIEICYATVNPGGIGTGAGKTVVVSPVLSPNGSQPATCVLGDTVIAAIPPAGAGSMAGLQIRANVSAAGQITVDFYNCGAGTVTPVSAQWQFIVGRVPANVLS
jgi:hypothetical protein